MAAISVDAGTTMIKAVGYDDAGFEVVVVRQQTTSLRPEPGWVEQDMLDVWNAVAYTVRGVARRLEEPVDYLALTAQGDGCWLVDDRGRPTGPAILWNDGRATDVVAAWERDGVLDEAFRINGSLGFAGLPHAILSWLAAHDPDRIGRSATALTCGGWLFSRFTGRIGVDTSDGAAPFLDVRTGRYSPALLELFGLQGAQRLLPELFDGERRVGELDAGAAGQLGLPAGTPVVLSSYDVASTAIGVGAIEVGQACSILGTTLCTEVVTDAPDLGGAPAGLTVPLGVPDRLLRVLPTLAGGEVLQWACRLLGLEGPAELSALAESADVGAAGLSFLPYLSPAGERAPFLDSRARGSLMGLSFDHTPAHVARAVLEGLTMVIRDCLSTVEVSPAELRVCGGGAASPAWCRLIADITGLPTSRSGDTEVGAKGAMITGAVLTGRVEGFAEALEKYVQLAETFLPDPARRQAYNQVYDDFVVLRECATTAWPRLAEIRARASITRTDALPAVTPEALARIEGLRPLTTQGTVTFPRRLR